MFMESYNMKIEIHARFKKSKTANQVAEDKEYIKSQRIIHGDDWTPEKEPDEEAYEYEPIAIDIDEVRILNPVDDAHTCIRTYSGDSWIIRANYKKFKEFYQKISKSPIHTYTA